MSSARMMGEGGAPQVLGKRKDESNGDDQLRFTKRFHLLSIGNKAVRSARREHDAHQYGDVGPSELGNDNSNYYIPVTKPASSAASTRNARHPLQDEHMQVDDTRDRVYIHNLDDELADIESEDEQLIFLPDIEKRLNRIPKHVLTGRDDSDSENQKLVLYGVPKSLTVDESQDSVRKAIVEARQRARDKAEEEARHKDMVRKYGSNEHTATVETAHGYHAGYEELEKQVDPDPDAMDLG